MLYLPDQLLDQEVFDTVQIICMYHTYTCGVYKRLDSQHHKNIPLHPKNKQKYFLNVVGIDPEITIFGPA